MSNFLKSFSPLLKKLKIKKYLLEIVLLTVALTITITAIFLYTKNSEQTVEVGLDQQSADVISSSKIFIDVSGAVKKPGLYQANFGARIKEVIDKAGGLSEEVDIVYFNRNFNLARIVSDQEKIYVPSILEINNGIFTQNQRTLDYLSPVVTNNVNIAPTMDPQTNDQLINLNYATIEELDQLPGIGQVTANKIISGRPYSTVEELITNKLVNKSVFEKIKNLIST